MLIVETTEFEDDPAGEHLYVSLYVELDASPFSGATKCIVRSRDLTRFLDELTSLAMTYKGTASLATGWGGTSLLELRLQPHGGLGHIALRVMIREHVESDSRVEATVVVEPQQLIEFAASLRGAIGMRVLKRISLEHRRLTSKWS